MAEHLSRDMVSQEPVANRKGVNFGPDPDIPRYSVVLAGYWTHLFSFYLFEFPVVRSRNLGVND